MEKLKLAVSKVRKALVGAAVVAVIQLAKRAGIELDNESVGIIVDAILVYGVVWAVPNVKPILEAPAVVEDEGYL